MDKHGKVSTVKLLTATKEFEGVLKEVLESLVERDLVSGEVRGGWMDGDVLKIELPWRSQV